MTGNGAMRPPTTGGLEPSATGRAFLGFAGLIWIPVLVFCAWHWERRTYPAVSATPTAADIASAMRVATAPGNAPTTPGDPATTGMNRAQRGAAPKARNSTS